MEEAHFPESSLDDEPQCSKPEDELNQDLDQDSEGLSLDQKHHCLQSGPHQVQGQDQDCIQNEAEHKRCDPDPPQDQDQDQIQVQDQDQAQDQIQIQVQAQDQDQDQIQVQDQDQDQGQRVDPSATLPQDQDRDQDQVRDRDRDQDQDQDQALTAANEEAAEESCGGVPALVITSADESLRPAPSAPDLGPAGSPVEPAQRPAGSPVEPAQRPAGSPVEPAQRPAGSPVEPAQRPADVELPVPPTNPSVSSSDGGDMTCSDLLSLSEVSLASEPTVSRASEEDDSRSVAASSLMSLFHRVQLDPLEKLWWRSSAVGNMAAQRQLLAQEPSLVVKKDFVSTALHWAAKQGRQESVELMLRAGADVNIRAGYTALHLASIHGHQHIVHALINTHNAKTSIRDYHGKTALHYWSGCSDLFSRADASTGVRLAPGRRTQRYALPSLLSRSRSQGHMSLEFGTLTPSSCHDVLDLQL